MRSPSSLVGFTAVLLFACPFAAPAAIEFHVSPGGNDSHPGSLQQPFATIGKARDAARARIATGLDDDLVVTLHAGTYQLGETLVLGPQDGGTAKHSVTWTAAAGEQVLLSGGRPVGNWSRVADGDTWCAEIPAVREGKWFFRQLYANGERMPRGRYPEQGFLKIQRVSKDHRTLTCSPALPAETLSGQDSEIVVIQNWSLSRELIASNTSSELTATTPIGWVGHRQCIPRKGLSAFLEHSPSFIKRPGQWALTRKLGLLSYRAAKGENPNERQFIAPVLEQLVSIRGSAEEPVRNLEFRDIGFAHSAFEMPKIGYAGIQACYYGTTQDEGLTFAVPAAFEMTGARDCRLTACTFQHLGGTAIGLGAGCRDNLVSRCEISDTGASGVNIGHMRTKNPLWADWKDPGDVPTGNEVSNCTITRCGAELWGAHGIFDAMTKGSRIRHNEISHLPYGGIATGYIWGTERSSQENCLIEFNHVSEVMLKLNDSGCIYTLGYQPGSVIRGNLLQGVRTSGFGGGQACNNGIFFDEGSKGFHLEDNVIFDIDQPGGSRNTAIRFNRSQHDWQTWKNNTIQIEPEPPATATALAAKAGLQPEYRKRN